MCVCVCVCVCGKCHITFLSLTLGVKEVHVDEKMKVVTTPAFMCDAPLHLIWDGIGKLVTALVKLM